MIKDLAFKVRAMDKRDVTTPLNSGNKGATAQEGRKKECNIQKPF